MGRILRIGTSTNYSFLETSAYDANNPAGTTGAWPDSLVMDQDFTKTSPTTVTAEGVLVTFNRLPDTFLGAMVKILPTYDVNSGEAPAFEMWTHSQAGGWVLRRHIDLTNLFVGVPSGYKKVLDLTFFPFLRDVNQVWLTMAPGTTGTPTMQFVAIKLFGQCDGSLRQDTPGGGLDPCANPLDPFYTGFDNDGFPCPGTTFGPPATDEPTLDICNEASIQSYRAFAKQIGFLDVFDAWLDTNRDAIAEFCAGTNPTLPTPPTPPGSPPALPPLDLCDQDSIDAFRAAVSGDPDQLQNFNDYIDGLTEQGFFDLTCPPKEPDEQYVDPHTGKPKDPPDTDDNTPFNTGPGGLPQFPRPGNRQGPTRGTQAHYATTNTKHLFFFFDHQNQLDFEAGILSESQDIQDAYNSADRQVFIYGNGQGYGSYTPGDSFFQNGLDRINLDMLGTGADDLLELQVLTKGGSPDIFRAWETNHNGGSVTSASLVDFLVVRGNLVDGIPDSAVEPGGDNTATVSQRKGIVVEGEGLPRMTVVTAYDGSGAHSISGSPGFSDEAVYPISMSNVTSIHKQLETLTIESPPTHNPAIDARHQEGIYIKVSNTKKFSSMSSQHPFDVLVSYNTVTS